MRNLILSTLSTLTLLIHPLSLSAQNSFSVSLDVDSSAGDQAVTSLNVSADQVIAIQIFGKDIQNANGLAVRFEYDASQVTYEGFDTGDVLPNAQALPEQGTNPTFVEIGIASLGGQATTNSGLMGMVRFRTTAAFSGTAIRLVRAEISRGGRFETIMPNIRIALQSAATPANFSLSMDVNGASGDQAATSLNVSADQVIAIQIFATDIQNANGLAVRFEYDASQVTYEGFDVGNVLPNAQALPEQGTNPTFVEIGIASLGGQATANSGLVGTVRFRTTAAFSGTAIRLVRAELSRGGRFETIILNTRIELQFQAVSPDFNGDGRVGFADFLAFGNQFGARQGDGRYEAKYDLDSDGAIGFGDFLIFGRSFGQEVSTPGGGGGGEETQITIPDANLRAAILARLAKASGAPITQADMATLTSLTAPKKDILDLTGLEFATGLTSLDLSNNEITDISVLTNLTNLISLNLSVNIIADITPLSGLTNLTSLNLSVNIIADITPLSGLTNLTSLNLSYNTITDISPLSGLTNLTRLRLHDNFFSDISPLSGLTSLTLLSLYDNTAITDRSVLSRLSNLSEVDIPDANLRAAIKIAMGKASDDPVTGFEMAFLSELEASNSNISDLTGLELATGLKSLNLGSEWVSGEGNVNSNHISDFSPLSGLASLTSLYLSGISISDVSELSALTNLTLLDISSTGISNVSMLSKLTNLTRLNLYNNGISNITPLSGLTSMRQLGLSRNSISDVSALSGLTSMIYLNLHNNSISDITPLSRLTSMTNLYLGSNSISDVSALSGMTRLKELALFSNSILDVSALSALTNLTWLTVSRNGISDISVLSRLTNLRRLYLASNSISNIAPLVANTGLGEGDRVDVLENPLSATSINTHIPALQSRGVEISFDPTPYDPTPVSIPDANLRAAIETNLNKAKGATITRSEMLKLTRLAARNANISDLTGLEFATNLQTLDLGSAWVSGSGRVNSNAISNFSALSSLTNLTRLDLDSSGISNLSTLVSVISDLTNLQTLELSNNSISDISALSSLTNLTRLNLGGELYSWGTSGVRLRLDSNTISDISPLLSLTNLQSLNLSGNDISDFSPLSSLTNLAGLELINAKISNLSFLSSLTGLTHLNLAGNTLSDLSPLRNLTSLTSLNLSVTEISDVSSLSALTNLAGLELSYNNISDVSSLSALTNLERLELSYNNISDVSSLSALTNLERLKLSGTGISDLSVLSRLTNLTWLSLSSNSISNIAPLSSLTNLTSLNLWRNSITDLSALSALTNLEDLALFSNSISNIAPLVANTGLGEGDRVDVRRNPLSATSLNTHIPALQGRGVDVRFGASKPAVEEIEPRMPHAANEDIVNGGMP